MDIYIKSSKQTEQLLGWASLPLMDLQSVKEKGYGSKYEVFFMENGRDEALKSYVRTDAF